MTVFENVKNAFQIDDMQVDDIARMLVKDGNFCPPDEADSKHCENASCFACWKRYLEKES